MSLKVTLASLPLETCVYNASGPRTGSGQALSKIAKSAAGAVLAKSATLESQTGNPLPRTWHHDPKTEDSHASMNSEGLPNAGIDYYISAETIDEAMGEGSSSKPYFVSISGKNINDNIAMIQKIHAKIQSGEKRIAGVELNLACPNIIGKPIIAYDFDQMEEVLEAVSKLAIFAKDKIPLGIKMPPYFDGPHYDRAAAVLNKYKHVVRYVASINTIGNCLSIDTVAEMPTIRSKGGFAGLSGRAVKYTALANVKKMRELLDNEIDVVGVGGVFSGEDAFEMILCGATAVQVGTCHWTEGPQCFDRICEELKHLMKKKGYKSVDDFRGKLKEWSKEGVSLSRAARMADKKKAGGEGTDVKVAKSSSGGMESQMTTAILVIVIAVLLADKLAIISI
eukprot:CAMPEP_0204621134 /NCGR_PEP_ID=MMETSP0717-20131115/6953_1 /ASSEMBLY_ACC=CAM_ASM_000666 /TAXON_ID=230516 /ORGANISM="Chaetoceros curvisetus" /LENGTH=394 /DNA_ID=CAMNT_0051635487 /DNA_START=1056 /DNA_END=2240 /DNA_ORIENTATION=+